MGNLMVDTLLSPLSRDSQVLLVHLDKSVNAAPTRVWASGEVTGEPGGAQHKHQQRGSAKASEGRTDLLETQHIMQTGSFRVTPAN